MIYISGDTHGDLERFRGAKLRKLKKHDTLIVCGDFGFVWDGSEREKRDLAWLSRRKYTIAFVEGAHESYTLLNNCEVVDFCGGKARQVAKNVYQLIRGEIFEIEGKKILAFGGGDDEETDLMDLDDCPEFQRLPSDGDIGRAFRNLEAAGGAVDYIVTYDAGFRLRGFLQTEADCFNNLHAFLDELGAKCRYSKWFFGCFHLDRRIPPQYYCVYREVLDAETGKESGWD